MLDFLALVPNIGKNTSDLPENRIDAVFLAFIKQRFS